MGISSREYNCGVVFREHCDYIDDKTREVLSTINESDQNKALINITNKLYDNIVDKVTDIDFGDIPKTKGDITKLPDYPKLQETIKLLNDLLVEFKQDTNPINIIETSVRNIINRKNIFEIGYKTNSELPMILYNTLVLSVISAVSLMISSSVEYIKQPNSDEFISVINKVAANKTKNSLLFSNLTKFNNSCKNGSFDKAITHINKSSGEDLTGILLSYTIVQVATMSFIALSIIPMMRELIYFFYYSRVRVSDYFDAQADLLQINAYNIERRESMESKKKENIVKKQMSVVKALRKLSNMIEVKFQRADKETTKSIVGEKKKYKADDIFEDQAPDSASALF